MNNPSVSLLTLTELSQNESLKILLDTIKKQTYNNIIEWVIVEGSQKIEDIICNKVLVNDMISNAQVSFNIKYIIPEKNQNTIGELRNLGNNSTIGDIIVCMGDNNYYFPTRVSHCVELLIDNTIDLALCNSYYCHDFLLNRTIRYENTYPLNDTFAYKRTYLKDHHYDDTQIISEELSFCNNFKDRVILLVPEHTMVQFIHNDNYEKYRRLFLIQYIKIQSNNTYTNNLLKLLLPSNYYEEYNKIYNLNVKETLDYDIVYLAGIHGIDWDPIDSSLGGSEQAIVKLSEEWVKAGKTVAVYSNYKRNCNFVHNGVNYISGEKFPFHKKIKTLISWRTYGVLLLMDLDFFSKLFKFFYFKFKL